MIKYLKLSRIGNVLIAFISVEVSGIMCGANIGGSLPLLLAAIAASLITAGGNAINDLYDLDIDRINRPSRPIASGRISPNEAKVFYFLTTASGIIITCIINPIVLLIAAVAVMLVFLYSYRFKGIVLLGNVVVAFVTGLAFIYGGASLHNFRDVYPAAIFAFMTNLIREIIKDAEDLKGDGAIGITTIATKYGTTVSSVISIALTALLLVMTWGAFSLRILPIQFLAVCALTILPMAVYITYLLMSRHGFSEASFGYKLVMLFGLVALIVGKI